MGKHNKFQTKPLFEHVSGRGVEDSDISVDSSGDGEDYTGGIDEAGMKRLMELLGDDALDEFDAARLDALTGAESGDEEVSDAIARDKVDDLSGSEEAALSDDDSESEGEDEEDMALDDVSSVDEDIVPKQKVVIDNKVGLKIPFHQADSYSDNEVLAIYSLLFREYGKPLNLTPPYPGQKLSPLPTPTPSKSPMLTMIWKGSLHCALPPRPIFVA
jgi:hypothetical protein